jgi:hypothetical protein
MPYDNEYNKKLARETDYNNRKYIAHCDTTGQGTINYRVNITTRVGYGGAEGMGEATFCASGEGAGYGSDGEESDSDVSTISELSGDGVGEGGQGILGIQDGTLLGGPKTRELTHRALSSFSSLGAPLVFHGNSDVPRPTGRLANGTSNSGLPAAPAPEAPPGAPAASAPPTDASAANINTSGGTPPAETGANPQIGPVSGLGVVPGLKPFSAPPVPITNSKYSYLTTARQYPSGYQYKAGKNVTVRDLGDVGMSVGSGGHKPCCSGCAHGDSCEDSDSAFSSSDDEERDVKNVIPVRVGGDAFERPSGDGVIKKKNETLGKMNKLEQEIIEDPVNKTLEKYDDMKTFKKKFKESIKGKSPKELKEFAKQATTIDKKVPENVEKKIDVYVDDKYGDGYSDKCNCDCDACRTRTGTCKCGCKCGMGAGYGCGSCGMGAGSCGCGGRLTGSKPKRQQQKPQRQQQQRPQRQQQQKPQRQQQSQKPQSQKKTQPTISKKAPPSIKSKPAPTTKSNNAPGAPTSKPTSSSKNAPPPPPNKPPTKPTKKETPEATPAAPAAPPGKPAPAPAKPQTAPPAAPPAKPGAPPAKPGAPPAKPGAPAAPATGGPKWLTNASKVLDVAAQAIQVVMLGKQAYDLFTKTPVDDFDNYFGDEYGDTSDLTIEELIKMLQGPPNNLSPEEIQDLLKESQGAKKVETGATSGPSQSLKVKAAALSGNKGKNKPPVILKDGQKPCPAAENAVADFTEQVPKEALPVRKQDSYFGSGEKPKRGRKPKLLNPNPNIHMAVPETKGVQTKVVEKALMNSSTMSGMGENKAALLNPNPNIKKAKRATKGQQTKVVEKAMMQSSTMSGMGEVKKGKKGDRAAIVKKIMQEKGMKMIEASKYVKENNLY